jgi:tubulin-folding cofactor B
MQLAQALPQDELNDDFGTEEAAAMKVGARCQVKSNGIRGEVAFIGRAKSLGFGYFVGVKLDEPLGDNDGSVDETVLFKCPKKFGKVLRPNEIEVGDFPELDLDED